MCAGLRVACVERENKDVIKGSCLCGKVSYTYAGEITEIAMCHCSQCRKAQGSAFATNSPLDANKLKFTGEEHITEFQSNATKVRAFCKHCGSPLYSARSDRPNIKHLRIGGVDSDFNCDKQYHIYVSSKATWHTITDKFPKSDEQP